MRGRHIHQISATASANSHLPPMRTCRRIIIPHIGPDPRNSSSEPSRSRPASSSNNVFAPPVIRVISLSNPIPGSIATYKMPSLTTMGSAAAPLVRPGASTALRRCVLGTAAQFPRTYAAMPSKERMIREMQKSAREGAKKTDFETMTQIQKRANDEYFKSGGGPLFPG